MNPSDPNCTNAEISAFKISVPPAARAILFYLEERLPGYVFDRTIDSSFVEELLEDFPKIDILEQLKAFRWYHGNNPAAKHGNLRVAIRRWLSNSFDR